MGYVMVPFGLAIFFATIALLLRARRLKVERLRAAPNWTYAAIAPVSKNNANVLMLSNYGNDLYVTANQKIIESLGIIEAQNRLIETVSVERSKIAAGLSGEKMVSEFLQRNLTGRWTIIGGFLGGKGEIDFVLIGPSGVFAIEVKNRNGIISCNGDDWSLTRPDGVTVPLMDNGGRSPAQQINESAGWLETELSKAGYAVKIPKAVIWSHPKTRLGVITNMSIQYLILLGANAPGYLRKYLALGAAMSDEKTKRIVQYIQATHQR